MILFIVSSLCRSIRWYPKRLASSLVWISKAIQKLRLGIQVQEEVLRTGFSLLSSKIDNEEMENMRHQAGGEHVLQPSPGTTLLLRSWAPSPCGLWQLPVPSFFQTGHMQLHVSFAHIITVIVTTVVVIIHANNQLDTRLEDDTSSTLLQTAFSAVPCWLSTCSKISLVNAALCSTRYCSLAENYTTQPNHSFPFSPPKWCLLETVM